MKDRGDVPFWDYEQVAGGDWIRVIPGISIFVVKNDVIRSGSAEDTGYGTNWDFLMSKQAKSQYKADNIRCTDIQIIGQELIQFEELAIRNEYIFRYEERCNQEEKKSYE
jgi:hypothetical protein